MDWASVVLAGISGALGAAVAYLFIRNPRERRTAYIVVFISSFAIFNTTFRVFLLPHIQVWQYERKVDQQLQKSPAYQAIRESDPRSYDRIREIVRDGIRDGQVPDIVASRIRGVISELVVKYIPHASDDAVIDLARVMVREIEQLTRVSPNVCYQFLFPEQYGSLDLSKYIDTKTQQDDLAALATLIRTATYHPQPEPDSSRSKALLEPVYIRLSEEYGDDVQLLDNPHGQSVDRKKVCIIIAALYKHVLHMPKKQSSMVLRYMFSGP